MLKLHGIALPCAVRRVPSCAGPGLQEVQTELDVGCRVSYRVRVDYDAMCEDEKRGVPRTEIYRKHVVVGRTLIVDDAGSHGTIFRISKLRPELLEQLRNSSFLASLGREVRAWQCHRCGHVRNAPAGCQGLCGDVTWALGVLARAIVGSQAIYHEHLCVP